VSDTKTSETEPSRLRTAATRFQRFVASPTSAALAYTFFCLVALFFAVCLEKMPMQVIERVERIRSLFS
jgi:hypothetical protein